MCSASRPRSTHVGEYRKRRAPGGPWCSSERRMSRVRSRMRSRLTRPSARASGPPGHEWLPRPNAMCDWAFRARCGTPPGTRTDGIAVGGAVEHHDRRPGRDVDLADRRAATGETEVRLHRALHPQHLLEEAGDELGLRPQLVLDLGLLGEVHQRGGEETGGRLLTRGEQERGGAYDRRSRRASSRRGTSRGRGRSARPCAARAAGPRCTARTSRRATRAD